MELIIQSFLHTHIEKEKQFQIFVYEKSNFFRYVQTVGTTRTKRTAYYTIMFFYNIVKIYKNYWALKKKLVHMLCEISKENVKTLILVSCQKLL